MESLTDIYAPNYNYNLYHFIISTMKHNQYREDGQIEEDDQQNQSSQEFITTTKAGRKDLCKICKSSLSKYTCPKCKQRTCSLRCTKKHKQLNDCKGFNDPTQKIDKRCIDQKVVEKDYQYVGDMISGTDKVRKCLTGITNHHPEPKRFCFLKKQAKNLYNIKIHQAPPIIERHRQNISFYYMKTQQIYWVLQLLYYQGNKKYSKHLLSPTPDSKTLEQILPQNFICNELLLKGINTMKKKELIIFIQDRDVDSKQKNVKSLFQYNSQTKLRQCLIDKHIFEFPTLILVHQNLKKQFYEWKQLS